MSKSNYLALLTAGLLLSCSDEPTSGKDFTPVAETHLVSAEQTSEVPLEMLKAFA